MDPAHLHQVQVLWDKGFGRALGMTSFQEYLATIPEVPKAPPIEYLNRLILVDRRLGFRDGCWSVGLFTSERNSTFISHDLMVEKKLKDVYWMWCQIRHPYDFFGLEVNGPNRGPNDYRRLFKQHPRGREVGLDVIEFAALYAQDPSVVGTKEEPKIVDILNSKHCVDGQYHAYATWLEDSITPCLPRVSYRYESHRCYPAIRWEPEGSHKEINTAVHL